MGVKPYQEFTISSASDDVATWTRIELDDGDGPIGETSCGDQVMIFDITSAATGGAATLGIVWLTDDDTQTVMRYNTANVSATARRTILSGAASGNYVCTTAFADTGTNKQDTLPRCSKSPAGPKPVSVWVGVPAGLAGGLSTLTVRVTTTRVV